MNYTQLLSIYMYKENKNKILWLITLIVNYYILTTIRFIYRKYQTFWYYRLFCTSKIIQSNSLRKVEMKLSLKIFLMKFIM